MILVFLSVIMGSFHLGQAKRTLSTFVSHVSAAAMAVFQSSLLTMRGHTFLTSLLNSSEHTTLTISLYFRPFQPSLRSTAPDALLNGSLS